MTTDIPQPAWNKLEPSDSLWRYAEWLREQAVHTFLTDKTHAHILFLFREDDGLVSISPIPPNTSEKQILNSVRQAVREHNLYGVITIAEAWTYFPKQKNDHTIVQLLHNEMKVSELREEDKTEALIVRMESRDGDGITWLNRIIRNGDDVSLAKAIRISLDQCAKQDRIFGE